MNKKEEDNNSEDIRQVGFITQLLTVIQNLGNRTTNLEILVQKSVLNESLIDKRIELLNARIEFIKEQNKIK